ncbi:DUF4352 domain-containing protein [Streptomyces swartbergensis]|uniref:DUF4352 domain-containing protein n=1 Tax=Streptomyces swartbergensis TaxID=487165 RepID=UPI00381B023D
MLRRQTETSTPAQTTPTSQQPSPTPSDTPSVASVGDTINLIGQEEGERVAVTVVKVVDPAKPENEFSSPDAGMRLVAVQFRLKNIGTQVIDEAPDNGAKIRDRQGQQFNSTITGTAAGPDFGGSVTLTPGDTALGFIVFEVPTASKIDRIQFTLARCIDHERC